MASYGESLTVAKANQYVKELVTTLQVSCHVTIMLLSYCCLNTAKPGQRAQD